MADLKQGDGNAHQLEQYWTGAQETLAAEQVSVEALFQDEWLSNWHSNL